MFSKARVSAIVLEHLLRLRHSFEEIVDTFYWPIMDIIIWGFMTTYFSRLGGATATVISFLLGGLILWTIAWRAQQDISVSLLWDVWNQNLTNLFATPLTPWEFLIGVIILGAIKIVLTVFLVFIIALVFYSFNLLTLGIYLLPFFANLLLFGWTVGIFVTALIFRFGRSIQNLAWGFIVLLNPVAAVYYPVSTLPVALQYIARLLPASYVFEGMRQVLGGKGFSPDYFFLALFLNFVYLIFSLWFFAFMFEKAREKGRLVKLEE